MNMKAESSKHYDANYFDWQSSVGEFGGWANLSKFDHYISKDDTVLDFGCGGGYLLQKINCKKKVGVEVGKEAASSAQEKGIEVYTSIDDVPEHHVDLIISNNALEHTLHPLQELRSLYKILRPGGKIIFVVPCESISYTYRPNDVNHHLYSWSPMSLGNLFTEAGFSLIESKPYIHKWPPLYRKVARYGGRGVFDFACRVWGRLNRTWFQVRAIAEKPL